MIVALIDNGSLEPAAHLHLRSVATALSARAGAIVHAVSWKHSDRIPRAALEDVPAWTLETFVRALVALGQREFLFVPFFISPQGAIGSALHRDLERLRAELDFHFTFTDGLAAAGVLPAIVAGHVRSTIAARQLRAPTVIVVDHGGPSRESAELRDRLTADVAVELGAEVATVVAASMEGAHPPLLAERLAEPARTRNEIVIAPLFLSPGRHAGPDGDLVRISQESGTRCHFAPLVGSHPLVVTSLAEALRPALSKLHVPTFA